MSKLQPLRIPSGWSINNFYDVEPMEENTAMSMIRSIGLILSG